MDALNPQQFKMDLGRYNASHDHMESIKGERAYRLQAGQAEPGYYRQPPDTVRQMALPGMEMSVQDHLDALGKATGTQAVIDSGKISHRLSLHEPREDAYGWGPEQGHLSWDRKRGAGQEDSGTDFEPNYHPGEIRMIRSNKPGSASAMLDTAEKLAREHGYAFPKHSHDRTSEGVPWSQKQMRKRGEKVW